MSGVVRARGAVVLAVVLLVAAVAVTTVILVRHRSVTAVEAGRADVTRVASDQAVAMLSYRHDTVDEQLASAAEGLVGDFREEYDTLVREAVAPSAKEKSIDTEVTVVGASVVSADADAATVLLFLNQVTTSVDAPEPTTTGSRVTVELRSDDGRWAVSGLTPV